MIGVETTLIILLIILSLGLIIPELFRKFRIPFVTILILLGAFLGPHGFDYIQSNEIIEFLGFLGMTFLLLMAGIETDLTKVKKFKNKITIMFLFTGIIPFIVGVLITRYFGYNWLASLIVGIIFISSSVAIIIPSLKSAKLFKKNLGQLILSSVLIADIVSLIALGFILQKISPVTSLPLFLYYPIIIIFVILLFELTPRLSRLIFKRISKDIGYERMLRFVMVVIFFYLVIFSLLGVHPILAAFLIGLTLSGIIRNDKKGIIYSKIHTLGYGLFIPIFFFVVGMQMDLSLFKNFDISNILMIALIFGLIISKVASGFLAGKLIKLKNKESIIFGTISTIQLTTTLAVTYAAVSFGLIDNIIATSIILLSIITTLIGPIAVTYLAKNKK